MEFDWLGAILLFIVAFLVVAFGSIVMDVIHYQPQIRSEYVSQYDVNDVDVFLSAIDSDWHEFKKSKTLRKTYEDVRDGKVSLSDIKKKKNDTTYIPMVIPIR